LYYKFILIVNGYLLDVNNKLTRSAFGLWSSQPGNTLLFPLLPK